MKTLSSVEKCWPSGDTRLKRQIAFVESRTFKGHPFARQVDSPKWHQPVTDGVPIMQHKTAMILTTFYKLLERHKTKFSRWMPGVDGEIRQSVVFYRHNSYFLYMCDVLLILTTGAYRNRSFVIRRTE